VINYQLKLYGFPIYWSSKISNYTNNKVFIDEQLKGPYKKWVHTHSFIPYEGGTLIVDEIKYQLPMGFLGNLFAGSFVKKDLSKIFGFRQKTIQRIFGT
jgi:ligand-binding SRPBCC domain-containing protein